MNNLSKDTFKSPENEQHFREMLWDILEGIKENQYSLVEYEKLFDKRYVRKTWAYIIGGGCLIFFIGILIGNKYLTFKEIVDYIL